MDAGIAAGSDVGRLSAVVTAGVVPVAGVGVGTEYSVRAGGRSGTFSRDASDERRGAEDVVVVVFFVAVGGVVVVGVAVAVVVVGVAVVVGEAVFAACFGDDRSCAEISGWGGRAAGGGGAILSGCTVSTG